MNNIKIGSEQFKKRIPASEFSPITVTDENGEKRELNSAETKKYIVDLLFGGQRIDTVLKSLIKAGVQGDTWADRQKIKKLLEKWFDNKLSPEDQEELAMEFEMSQEDKEEEQ